MGMSYELYWDGDCRLVESYRKADSLKRAQKNQEMWLQGMYVYEAICDAAPLLHAFSKKPKPLPYPSEPYALFKKEIDERREKVEQLAYEKAKSKTAAWAARTNTQLAVRAGKDVNDG
jgi:hypothetical protein